MIGHNLTPRAPLNRRSLVTKWTKTLKRQRDCVFLTEKYNLEMSLEAKVINHKKTSGIPVIFQFFMLLTTWLTFFSNLFLQKDGLISDYQACLKIILSYYPFLRKSFFLVKKLTAVTHDTVVVENFK